MKFDPLQSDFSVGELSPKAQGQVGSEIYKAAVKRMANIVPTRTGSAASRAGGKLVSNGYGDPAFGPGVNQGPVQHLPVQDGPFADFMVEIGPKYIRLMDKFGVIPWHDIPQQFLKYTDQSGGGNDAWGDPDTRTIRMRHTGFGQAFYSLVSQISGGNPNAYPAGTNESWTLTGNIAGSDIQIVVNPQFAPLQNFTVSPGTDGRFSITFTPTFGGVAQAFAIDLYTLAAGAGDKVATLWNLHLVKNANPTAITHGLLLPTDFFGVDRIRSASCWVNMNLQGVSAAENPNFWVIFAGGVRNVFSGYSIRWVPSTQGPFVPSHWSFQFLPQPPAASDITGCATVAVYQDRIWFGRNLAGKRPQLIASKIGFVDLFNDGIYPGGDKTKHDILFVFQVVAETYTVVGANVAEREDWNVFGAFTCGATDIVRFCIPGDLPPYPTDALVAIGAAGGAGKRLLIYKNGMPVTVLPGPFDVNVANPGASLKCTAETPQIYFGSSRDAVGGVTYWKHGAGLLAGDVLTFTTIPLATDPLVLTMSSAAKIAWLHVLRGLMMGTTQSEKLFSQGQALTLDPATGQAFSLNDESWLGADERLTAVGVNDKVLYAQRGRTVLRMANISITNNGGLISEDVGVMGEHLTAPKIRGMCFLKSPVQRVVFALDDGTGAVMTLGGKAGVAWSRFTIPAAYGGIYSVAALNGSQGSELWVGTENGVTLQWDSFESDIQTFTKTAQAVYPAGTTRTQYDIWNPYPPVMDGWARCGLSDKRSLGNGIWVSGLSRACVGQNAYALVNGQVFGPYPVVLDSSNEYGRVILPDDTTLAPLWVDPAGVSQPQDAYLGLAFPEHQLVTLPLEGGNPAGTSQSYQGRRVQCHVRLVDSYAPVVGGQFRVPERGPEDLTDVVGGRITGDRRVTQLSFQRGETLEISQDLPLRIEVSAIFGGTVVNSP